MYALIYVDVESVDKEGRIVPDAELPLTAATEGSGLLAGFGSGNPVTAEDYTDSLAVSYRGRALAVIRAGYDPGAVTLKVAGAGLTEESVTLTVK